jgi:hypothetical protein
MIQDMLCEFEAYLREMDASFASIKAYLCDLRKFIRWYEDTASMHPKTVALIRLDIVEFRNYLERSARQKPTSINRALALSVYFSWAVCCSRGISMAQRLEDLNAYLRGWIGYFRLAYTPSVLQSLDEWLRRRLRMCLLKQWKKPKTKRRNLIANGIPNEWAVLISSSRKGYWRLAMTPQLNKALGLA